VFATYLPKLLKGTFIIAMIEGEEIDNALKKRIHTVQELVIGAFNDNNVDVTHKHALSK
jgi:ABC-type antimicrobial peptide transport system permease subunit